MEYQTARSELQSPPHRIPLLALALETGTVLAVTLLLAWWF